MMPIHPKTKQTRSDNKIKDIMQDTLDDFISSKKMFTAFDITTDIRNKQQSAGIHVFHSVVKEYVHDAFENGITMTACGYDRVLTPIGNPNPWLYYIPGVHNPSSYNSSPTNQPPVTQPKAKSGVATFGGFTGGQH